MDLTRPNEEARTEDVQAGVIRAIYRSRTRLKKPKDGMPSGLGETGSERKRPAKGVDPAGAGRERRKDKG